MEKQSLIMEKYNENKKRLLVDKLAVIESALTTDILSYYGFIEKSLVSHFIRLMTELHKKSKNDELTIILHSRGGDNESMNDLYNAVYKLYKVLNIIITDQVVSTGTIFTFMSDKILINDTSSSFSMIDPQVPTPQNINCSIFHEFKANGYECELKDTDKIDESIMIIPPKKDFRNPNLYEVQFLAKKNALMNCRYMCYDMLINHQFKNLKNKEKKAIKLINYLMDAKRHVYHTFKIYPDELKKYGLNMKYYTDDSYLSKIITDYDESVRYMIGKSENYFYDTTGYGNYLNCLIQSKYQTII